MRTLKKTLCLVLVLTMMVGLCAFGASATEFTDADKITHTDAATVLDALGIIKGNADGTFNPEGTLRRAEAAVIIARLLAMDDITANPSFTDLDNYKWAKNAIAVCEAEGIVLGVGGGKFNPGGKLTGSAWGKMLLKAIGYEDPDLDNGSKWEIAVAKGIKATNLKDGLDSFDGTAQITRDDAAQMAFNALTASTTAGSDMFVAFNDDDGDGKYDKSKDTTLYTGTDPLTALTYSAMGATLSTTKNIEGSLGAENFNLDVTESTDAFGRSTTKYTNTATNKVMAEISSDVVATFTTATTYGAIAKACGAGATAANAVNLNIKTNGGAVSAKTGIVNGDKTAIGGQGTLIEVYKNKTAKTFDVIVIETNVWKLQKANLIKADPTKDQDAGIELGTAKLFYKTSDAYKTGDVVLYTVAGGAVQNVVKADTLVGEVTATAAAYFRVDGTQMKLAAKAATTTAGNVDNSAAAIGTNPLDAKSGTARTFYLDSYGNVIYAENGKAAAATVDTKPVYVIDSAAKITESGASDLFGTGASSSTKAQAKVLDLESGEVKVVDLATVKNTSGKLEYAKPNGSASGVAVKDAKAGSGLPLAADKVYQYAIVDGKYAIDQTADTAVAFNVTKGAANATVAGATSYLTSKTTITVVEYTKKSGEITGASVKTTTGYANAETASYTNAFVVVDDDNYVVSALVVKAKSGTTTTTKYAFFKGVGETNTDGETAYEFYEKGELKSYIDTDNKYDGTKTWAGNEGKLFALTYSSKKLTGTLVTAKIAGATITNLQDEYMVVNDGTKDYTVYFATGCYAVEDGGENLSELAVNDKVDIYGDTALAGTVLKDAAFIVVL
jgi:hypothetical protein